MKVWYGFGSEHSSKLVMIGHFADASKAAQAKDVIDRLSEYARSASETGDDEVGRETERYPKSFLNLLQDIKIYSIAPQELEQFLFDVRIDLQNDKIALKTDEIDVSAFLKVFIDSGARVEVYSSHFYKSGQDTE